MHQTSLLSVPSWPETFEDIESLYREYIFENEKDSDTFSFSDIKNGRSYFFYGLKSFEFYPVQDNKPSKWRIPEYLINPDQVDKTKFISISPKKFDPATVLRLLKDLKRSIFRNTITEEFGCCNDFIRCSDAKACLHPEDRFYNGCGYRKNLEAGRIFYGVNRNV